MYTTRWRFKTARFTVTWDTEPETDPDLSWDATGEVRANIDSGRFECFTSRLSVTRNGHEVGMDYLSESIYANPDDFRRNHIGARGDGSYFRDMVSEAIRDARVTLAQGV